MTLRQFENIVPVLETEYHVFTVSFDGYDETGKTTYTTAEEQVHELAAYIRENLAELEQKHTDITGDNRLMILYSAALMVCAMDKAYMTGLKHIRYTRITSVAEGDECCDCRLCYEK